MKHPKALQLAQEFLFVIEPVCEQIQIAGSLRREKPEVKDIEIVAIPRIKIQTTKDLFDQVTEEREVSFLENHLFDLIHENSGWDWGLDGELKRNGPRYKRFRHELTDICLDLFITTKAGWGGALAIRTGPADFSKALVTLALRQRKHVADGYLIHQHRKSRKGCAKGAACHLIMPTPTEEDFFAALILPWVNPQGRTEKWVWEQAKTRVIG